MATNRTFTMLKPDAVSNGYIGGILKMINDVHQKNILPNMNIIFNGIKSKKILGYHYGNGYGYGYGYGYGGKGYYSDQVQKKSFLNKWKTRK